MSRVKNMWNNTGSKNCPNELLFSLICYTMSFNPNHMIQIGLERKDDIVQYTKGFITIDPAIGL